MRKIQMVELGLQETRSEVVYVVRLAGSEKFVGE